MMRVGRGDEDVDIVGGASEEALTVICEEFGLGELLAAPERIGKGVDTDAVWRVRAASGTWAVKASSPTTEASRVDARVRFERELVDADIGLPRPLLTLSHSGTVTLPSGHVVSVREWVDAPAASWHPQERRPEHALLLAALLARLHRGKWHNALPLSSWASQRRARPHWETLLATARAQGRPWSEGFADALPRLAWAEEVVTAASLPVDYRMCHLDANPHNVLLVDEETICVIDWDGAGLASASGEIVSVIANWACCGDGRGLGDLPARMLEAYRANGGVCNADTIDVFAQHFVGWLNWIEYQVELALSKTLPEETQMMDAAVNDLIAWAQRIAGVPDLLEQLRRGL